MINNLRFISFSSMRKHGQMNANKIYYPEDMTALERSRIMKLNKKNFAQEFGLDSKRIFIPIQKNNSCKDKYEDGKTLVLTKEILDTYEDLYDFDYFCDIVKVTQDTPNVAIAEVVADCAVVKAVNLKTGEAVISHCGGEYIDRYLPMQTIDALGGREEDVKVYISPFAHELFYQNAENLKWAVDRNGVWSDCIIEEEKNGMTSARVDIYKALKRQLLERKIREENLIFSNFDTAISTNFYSNSRQYQDKSYLGRFLSGIAIVEDNENLRKADRSYIRVIK